MLPSRLSLGSSLSAFASSVLVFCVFLIYFDTCTFLMLISDLFLTYFNTCTFSVLISYLFQYLFLIYSYLFQYSFLNC